MRADALTPRPHYRRDIDGLRALAILPVVFYHYRLPGFGGGFVGVDIFFVISGYLITQLLISAERPPGLVAFYVRRVRRLLPALAAMLLTTTIAGLILLPPTALIAYGKSLISVGVAGSNVFFWRALASYFAAKGENHPLLHTWSLAVEEQFYLAYPLFLIAIRRLSRRGQALAVLAACAASFVLAAWWAPRAPSASFYLAPTRAWELLAGAALNFVRWDSPRRLPTLLGVIGLAMIGLAVATFNETSQVPGLAAALPCAGALMLIHIGQTSPGNPVSRLLAARPLVAVGLISYALYLWHWPINVFLRRYIPLEPPGPATAVAAILLSFVLAGASWLLIERPIRRGVLLNSPTRAFGFAAMLSAALIAAGAVLATGDGLPWRFPGLAEVAMQPGEQQARYDLRMVGRAPRDQASSWQIIKADPSAGRVFVWGDSYASHLRGGFDAIANQAPFSVYRHVDAGCPPVLGFDPASLAECKARNDAALDIIEREHITTVVLAGRWQSYLSTGKLDLRQISETVRRLRAMGLRVIVIGQPPEYAFDFPDEYHYRQVRAGRAARDEGWAANVADPGLNGRLRQAVGPIVFDPTPLFCHEGRCQYRAACLYQVRDNGHLTAAGSERLVRALLPVLGDGR